MRKFAAAEIILSSLSLLILCGCSMLSKTPPEPTPDLQKTVQWLVDDAVMAASTQIMFEVRQQIKTIQPTVTPENTSVTVDGRQWTPTVTSIWHGLHDDTGYEMTPTPLSCVNGVKFVQDVTIPDGTSVLPGKPFTKTWRLRNVGSCVWDENYSLFFSDGDRMSAKEQISFPEGVMVKPDDTIEISVYMTAPEKIGHYAGYWLLRDAAGTAFGTGEKNDRAIWVKVEVK